MNPLCQGINANIKTIRADGTEFWSARELAQALDYSKWENFMKVIKRAMIACENSGHNIQRDFPEVRKIVEADATKKPIIDYELSFENEGWKRNTNAG